MSARLEVVVEGFEQTVARFAGTVEILLDVVVNQDNAPYTQGRTATHVPLDVDAAARILSADDVLHSVGETIGCSLPDGSLAKDVVADHLERLTNAVVADYSKRLFRGLLERWGEDYEDNAEFHHVEARSHEITAELIRNLANDLDRMAEAYESLAKSERQRARSCEGRRE